MSSSDATFYKHQTLNLHARYKLSENAKKLLRDHDQWKQGKLQKEELGRLVRMSPEKRKSITEAIIKCTEMMRKKPAEDKNCLDIIQACTEILDAAGKKCPLIPALVCSEYNFPGYLDVNRLF